MNDDFDPILESSNPVVPANNNSQTANYIFVYGKRPRATSGLVWGYYGGRWGGFAVAEGTLTLTNTGLNHVVVAIATGVISTTVAATNWNDTTNFVRVYKITCAGGVVTDVEDHRAGPGGITGGGAGGGGTEIKGLTFTSDTGSTADSDPGAGLMKWNNATQASATVLFFDNLTLDAVSLTTLWASLGATGFIYLQQADDPTKWQEWKWTALPVDGTGYRKFTVVLQASGGSIADNKTVYADFESSGTAPTFIAPRIASTASSATPTPDADTTDLYIVTALAEAAAFAAPSGTPVHGQPLMIRIKDNATARALTWNAIYRALGVSIPSITVLSKTLYVGALYNSTDTKWDVVAVRQEA